MGVRPVRSARSGRDRRHLVRQRPGLATNARYGGGYSPRRHRQRRRRRLDRLRLQHECPSRSSAAASSRTGLTHFSQVGTFSLNADPSQRVTAYAVHLKSGTASSDRNQRTTEAALLRADADALGSAALGNLIYLGDFNWQRSSEGAWGNLTASGGAGRGFDPINSPGDWHDNAAFLGIHTQDPSSQMDDRFDVQLMGGTLFDGLGLDYAEGSYRAVGNDGTHLLNTAITTGTGSPVDVLSSLASFDHLPVVSELNLVAVPEPGSLLVLAGGGGVVLLTRRADGYDLRPARVQPAAAGGRMPRRLGRPRRMPRRSRAR